MEPVAIIGLAFKLPQGVEDESGFWDVLEQGKSLMNSWPESRSNINSFLDSGVARKNRLPTSGAHFLHHDPTVFDAPFFSISSKEAASMDPQQRMLLESSYHALESAGIPIESVAGTSTGVYAGSMESDYHRIISKDPDTAPTNTATGASVSILANRLSWYFDLRGPSIQLNTACSSSMIAVDLACQSLRSGQSSMALVAGSNVMLSPELSLYLANMNMLSPSGVSYSFDHRADGYSRGEGVIVLVLKTLCAAIQNSDPIRAVIRGTGSNQDGRTPGITQPSPGAQESLIRTVYKTCGLELKSTRYVEAHGTGTQIGDSIEMKAIGAVFRSACSPVKPLYVGSVKSNIGHLEGGSGLAGILKCTMILEKGIIPPNALFEKLNPKIQGKRNHIQVPQSTITWPGAGLRRVSVNSFGFGGSNAHCILDDAYHTLETISLRDGLQHLSSSKLHQPEKSHGYTNGVSTNGFSTNGSVNGASPDLPIEATGYSTTKPLLNGTSKLHPNGHVNGITQDTPDTDSPAPVHLTKRDDQQLLIFTARDEAALQRVLQQYGSYHDEHIRNYPAKLNQLAHTLSDRRSLMTWRAFTVGDAALSAAEIGTTSSKCVRSSLESQICFIFTGQGAQYASMGLSLMHYPIFKSTLTQVDNFFQELGADWSLFEKIQHQEDIHLPQFSQPLCTALQLALVELLRSFKITPVAVVGHSSGEIAAAYTVGGLSFKSACKAAYYRGKLSGALATSLAAQAQPGAMMSVNIAEGNFRAYIAEHLSGSEIIPACINSPSNITVAGLEAEIDALKRQLDHDGIFAQKITTGLPYHTPVMRKIAGEYLDSLDGIESAATDGSAILMVSSVTGQKVSPDELSKASYWVDNLVSPVRFVDALHYLIQAAPRLDGIKAITDFVEIGPSSAMRRSVIDTLGQISNKKESRYVSVLSRRDQPLKTVMEAAGHLFANGYPVSISAVNRQSHVEDISSVLIDVPKYPFDHSRQYWYESRLSRDWRLRGVSPTNVLGIRATDWNPIEPRWRKFLSVEEMPWIADHVVDGVVIFPAAGSVVMALEAVRQTAQTQQPITGYLLKSATFSSPIIIHAEERTEVVTQLRNLRNAYERASLRFEIVIFSITDSGAWNECFKGVVHAETTGEITTEVDAGSEARAARQACSDRYEHAQLSCTKSISKQHFYEWLEKQSLTYGETFAIADDIFWDGEDLCIARVKNSQEPFGVVHPTVLDSCLQMCSAAPSKGMTTTLGTFIPHQLRDTWISASGWDYHESPSIRINTQSKLSLSSTKIHCAITVLAEDQSLLCHARHVEMSAVAKQATTDEIQKQLLNSIEWKPQLTLLSLQQLSDCCGVDSFTHDETFAIDYCVRLESALIRRLAREMPKLRGAVRHETPAHFERFLSWLDLEISRHSSGIPEQVEDESLEKELETLRTARPSWAIFFEVLQNLASIISTETNALELLFSQPLAQNLYDEFFLRTIDQRLFSFLELATHQAPKQRILEVGAGTGGMTNQILKMLHQIEQRTGGAVFHEYVYTDVSPAYFEKAQERFAPFRDRMSFKVLDLEQDVTASIEPGSCDMILAGSVLHATKNLAATLSNLRRALKPGGHIIFLETTAPDCFVLNFGFGILPGWWSGEEKFRQWSPTVTAVEWDVLLRNNGFSGNDLVIRDYVDNRAHYVSIIVSSAVASSTTISERSRILIVVDDQDEEQNILAFKLTREAFDPSTYDVSTVSFLHQLADDEIRATDKIVFLADIEGSHLAAPSTEFFQRIQRWVQQSKQLLWVTASSMSPQAPPYASLKDGLLRVVRSESSSKKFVSLSLEDAASDDPKLPQYIKAVVEASFEAASPDFEYVVRDGRILTGRLVTEGRIDNDLNSLVHAQTRTEAWLPGPPVKLEVGTRGSLDTLRFVEDEVRATLGPTEIEIECKTWALGFRDVFSALGRLDENEYGTDCAGVVRRVGSQCTILRPGDRVCSSLFGCMRTYVYCDEIEALKLSDDFSLEEACAAINPVMTAWYSLVDAARLKRGEKILIHAAAGATGQLAIQVARMIGAEVFVTVGFDYKKQLLSELYGIPDSHIFYSRDLSFVQGIMRVTNGYGVDVVLNSLVGEGLRASWECIAPYGRFIEIGKADIQANAQLPMLSFASNASFIAVDLRHMTFERKDMARKLFFKGMGLVQDGILHCPRPWNAYSVSAVEDAFRYLQSGKSTGRIVIQIEPTAKVQKHLIRHRVWKFDPTASYMVAAGLGGVGRSILRWMASRGAKQLIVPSRSGAASEAAIQVVEELTQMGVKVATPKCDVAVAASVQKVLDDHASWGPVRGCINATMVLGDSIFDNMTRAQWDATIRSKVQTSWNLHNLLPNDLDFFILLSSASGVIGNAGQSNYAAGCTFQDSLSRIRVAQGRKGLSIDLGPMRSVGFVAEHEDLTRSFDKYAGLDLVEEKEFLALLNIVCDPEYELHTATAGQLTMGIVTPDRLITDGGDLPLEHLHPSLFAYFRETGSQASVSSAAGNINSAALFRQAETAEEKTSIVVDSLVRKLARAMSMKIEDIDVDRALHLYGVDSLVALELRNWITREFAVDVPVFELMSGKTILGIGEFVTKGSGAVHKTDRRGIS